MVTHLSGRASNGTLCFVKYVTSKKDWKNIGYAGKIDQKLWKQFRAACDHFFNAKQN